MVMGAVWWYRRSSLLQYLASMERSRYQLCTLDLRFWSTSMALGPKVTGARPGGTARHFWVPL